MDSPKQLPLPYSAIKNVDIHDPFATCSNPLGHFPDCTCKLAIDHPSHAKPGIHPYPDRLHVLTMLSNPMRWRSRYWNYHTFEAMVNASPALLYTAEVAFGGRHYEVTQKGNPRHLQLRTDYQVWHKENALNLLAERLPDDAKYIAWIDADVQFVRTDWAQEILHLLQIYDILQCFSHVQNIGPNYEPVTSRGSFMWNYHENRVLPHFEDFGKPNFDLGGAGYSGVGKGKWNHTGFAWAMRRSAWNKLGGLMDWCILGSADYHQAAALVGNVGISLNEYFPPRYVELCKEWQARAEKHIISNPNGGVGYMPGLIIHHFHGSTKNRAYNQRWKLLSRTGYNPDLDLKRDVQGLYQLTDRSAELRDGIRVYNKLRDEDSLDTSGML